MHHVQVGRDELAHDRWKSGWFFAVVSFSFGEGETTARKVIVYFIEISHINGIKIYNNAFENLNK